MKSLGEYPFFVLSIFISFLFVISLFTIGLFDKTIVFITVSVLGTIGAGSWAAFLIKWQRDKKLVATGKIVKGKVIRDSIKYQLTRSGYRISADIAVYEREINKILLFKDEILTSFEKADSIRTEQGEILVRVIYDESNPKRYIAYLRDAIDSI